MKIVADFSNDIKRVCSHGYIIGINARVAQTAVPKSVSDPPNFIA